MGGSPKASTTASGRGNQPAVGDPESNLSCPGPVTSREMATVSGKFSETDTLDIELGQGPVTTKVLSTPG